MHKMNLFSNLLHKISHWTGHNSGRVVSWHDGGTIRVGFMCAGCGAVDPKSVESIKYTEENYDGHSNPET